MNRQAKALVVGGGVFGLAAATELRERGWEVTLIDPGPIPHPRASSTDISKAVRMDYGGDVLYTEMAERCIERWQAWNAECGEQLYHEVGFLLMAAGPMKPGSFEGDGFELLTRRGHALERIDRRQLARRFPAWNSEHYQDGYLNPRAGWARSGRAVELMAGRARDRGVTLREGVLFDRLREAGGRIAGVASKDGESFEADTVVMAAGAWTPALVPELTEVMSTVGQPVLHLAPEDPAPYRAANFPVWGADISNTGWYGFPVNAEGILKIGHHGVGIVMHPDDDREVDAAAESRCRSFLERTFPGLADAPRVGSRVCMYCDTFDGDFWIDHHPARPGLVVAAGGSGHGFKFAPLLGPIIADVVEGRANRFAERFAWRRRGERKTEQARHDG